MRNSNKGLQEIYNIKVEKLQEKIEMLENLQDMNGSHSNAILTEYRESIMNANSNQHVSYDDRVSIDIDPSQMSAESSMPMLM